MAASSFTTSSPTPRLSETPLGLHVRKAEPVKSLLTTRPEVGRPRAFTLQTNRDLINEGGICANKLRWLTFKLYILTFKLYVMEISTVADLF